MQFRILGLRNKKFRDLYQSPIDRLVKSRNLCLSVNAVRMVRQLHMGIFGVEICLKTATQKTENEIGQ